MGSCPWLSLTDQSTTSLTNHQVLKIKHMLRSVFRLIIMFSCLAHKRWVGLWYLTPISTIFQIYRSHDKMNERLPDMTPYSLLLDLSVSTPPSPIKNPSNLNYLEKTVDILVDWYSGNQCKLCGEIRKQPSFSKPLTTTVFL